MNGSGLRSLCIFGPFLCPRRDGAYSVSLKSYGGDDETRTRDLCRDSVAWLGFTTTYKTCGDCQTTRKSYKTSHSVGWGGGWKKSRLPKQTGGLSFSRQFL